MPLAPARAPTGSPCASHGGTPHGSRALGNTLSDELSVDLGVLHLEDVELDLLAGELLELTADAVGFGAATSDDDARTGGVDVDADTVTGALDVDLRDAGPLEALGHHLTDLDVFEHVVAVARPGLVESANHFDLWSVVIPSRNPFGLIFWPISGSPSRLLR